MLVESTTEYERMPTEDLWRLYANATHNLSIEQEALVLSEAPLAEGDLKLATARAIAYVLRARGVSPLLTHPV